MRKIFLLTILFCVSIYLHPSVWQWSVELKGFVSTETNKSPEAFLWIPENCEQVRSVVFGQHNMSEEAMFTHPQFRKVMAELGVAIVWVTPGFEQQWKVENGCQKIFDEMMADLAVVSGYSELEYAPIIPLGHSAMATFPWNFAAWNPERTLAIISFHGDAPRTNLTGYGRENLEWGRNRNIDGIPGLMIQGEYEWWEARVNPALAFRMMYPESCISFLCDTGRGHFDASDEVISYISAFIKKATEYRLPSIMSLHEITNLKKLEVKDGWLAQRWHPNQTTRTDIAPFLEYGGDRHDAFWYFDEQMAEYTEKYYASESNKQDQYIGFYVNNELQKYNSKGHAKYRIVLDSLNADLTFNVTAFYTDSLRTESVKKHSKKNINIYSLSGPVVKLDDNKFGIRFYNMGLNNKRRTASACLISQGDGDDIYKTTVQEIAFDFPYPQKDGIDQQIYFNTIGNVKEGIKSIQLKGYSDKKLPVYYYVKEGPAEVKGNKLEFTKIPPRSKYPLKVTVVAWQYGQTIEPKIKSATPIERTFYIEK